jgi:gluconate kinase
MCCKVGEKNLSREKVFAGEVLTERDRYWWLPTETKYKEESTKSVLYFRIF